MIERHDTDPTTLSDAPPAQCAAASFVSYKTFDLFATSWQRQLRHTARWNGELLRFAAERWRKNLYALIQMSNCRSAAEAFCVHFEVAADAATDYLTESQQILAGIDAFLRPGTNARTLT